MKYNKSSVVCITSSLSSWYINSNLLAHQMCIAFKIGHFIRYFEWKIEIETRWHIYVRIVYIFVVYTSYHCKKTLYCNCWILVDMKWLNYILVNICVIRWKPKHRQIVERERETTSIPLTYKQIVERETTPKLLTYKQIVERERQHRYS